MQISRIVEFRIRNGVLPLSAIGLSQNTPNMVNYICGESLCRNKLFSACVSTRTSEKIAGWRASSNEWWETRRHDHELFVSGEVVLELSDPEYLNNERALKLLEGLTVLEMTREIEQFAEVLVKEKVMPGPSVSGDAVHVALAAMHHMDYILTWNVRHLANVNKRTHFAVICMRAGLVPPVIVTPDML